MLFHATYIWLYATSCNLVSSTQNPCSSNPRRNGSTVQRPSVSMIIISAHAHQDLKERTAVKL